MVFRFNLSMAIKTVSGEVRLPDPVDDAILTLGVRHAISAFV